MSIPQTPSPPHLYPQAIQLKLYQAFIFSIPILFSIILFLLFYLFYLKRRASTLSSPPPILPRSLSQATLFAPTASEMGLKGKLKEKLPIVLFDEDLRAKDSQCCVCLGEFEMKEELHQVPSCGHVFHMDCLNHWLRSNSTCPLCRCSVIPTTKLENPESPTGPDPLLQHNSNSHPQIISNSHPQIISLQQQQQQLAIASNLSIEQQQGILMEGSSSANTCLRDSGRLSELSISMDNEMGCPDRESVVLHIQTHHNS